MQMTLKAAQQGLRQSLSNHYDLREAGNIAGLVMENLTGKDRIARILDAGEVLTVEQLTKLEQYLKELLEGRPVQYVLGKAHFAGLDLIVNEAVLIPRPETEELVHWVGESLPEIKTGTELSVLDIGTGSGCIAFALKDKFPGLSLTGLDISASALEIARLNAEALNLEVDFVQKNILDQDSWSDLPDQDVIVSNPPYIHLQEKEEMEPHVLDFEPHQALFVENQDVLIFYREIARFAAQKLRDGGQLFFEINASYATDMLDMLKKRPFASVELKRDMQGRERMIKCLVAKGNSY